MAGDVWVILLGEVDRDSAASAVGDLLEDGKLLLGDFRLLGHRFHDRVSADADDVGEALGAFEGGALYCGGRGGGR